MFSFSSVLIRFDRYFQTKSQFDFPFVRSKNTILHRPNTGAYFKLAQLTACTAFINVQRCSIFVFLRHRQVTPAYDRLNTYHYAMRSHWTCVMDNGHKSQHSLDPQPNAHAHNGHRIDAAAFVRIRKIRIVSDGPEQQFVRFRDTMSNVICVSVFSPKMPSF